MGGIVLFCFFLPPLSPWKWVDNFLLFLHTQNPFSPFLLKRWTFFFPSYNCPFLWNGCTICILLLMSISFEIAWYLFFWPPLISFLYKMVECFLCAHIFTPITLSMKSEIKHVNLCVLKMFSSNFHDFLSNVSSPSYTSKIHKWHFSFGWKNMFFQVFFFSCAKKWKFATKEITSYNCTCPIQSFKPFALVCLRMSSSNFFNPSLWWHIIFRTCIRRGKKMTQLQAYAHMFISNPFDINKKNIYICMIKKLSEIDTNIEM